MAAQLPHSECGFFTFVSGTDRQTFVNALTGESVFFNLPVKISDGGCTSTLATLMQGGDG